VMTDQEARRWRILRELGKSDIVAIWEQYGLTAPRNSNADFIRKALLTDWDAVPGIKREVLKTLDRRL
jgi:hypothetical protein